MSCGRRGQRDLTGSASPDSRSILISRLPVQTQICCQLRPCLFPLLYCLSAHAFATDSGQGACVRWQRPPKSRSVGSHGKASREGLTSEQVRCRFCSVSTSFFFYFRYRQCLIFTFGPTPYCNVKLGYIFIISSNLPPFSTLFDISNINTNKQIFLSICFLNFINKDSLVNLKGCLKIFLNKLLCRPLL